MKKLLFYSIIVTILFSCKKDDDTGKNEDGINNYTIVLSNCSSITNLKSTTQIPYGICFDSITDSRCPQNVQCIWQGYAEVKLRLTVANNTGIPFKLSTIKNPSIILQHPMIP
jgi:hypothetical protein